MLSSPESLFRFLFINKVVVCNWWHQTLILRRIIVENPSQSFESESNSSEYKLFRAIPNQSERNFESSLTEVGQRPIRFNPNQLELRLI